MPLSNERGAYLLNRYGDATATPEEEQELYQWVAAEENAGMLKEYIITLLQEQPDDRRFANVNWDRLFANALQTAKEKEAGSQAVVRPLLWRRIAVAASIVLVLSVGAYFYFSNKVSDQQAATNKPQRATDIKAPAANRAMITLANGEKIYLDSSANGALANEQGINLVKLNDGKIVYKAAGSPSGAGSKISYNTLNNPRGSRVIDITLSDGSQVWLNAGSSVTYPVAFVEKERKVEITGEAYFEVAHDKTRPFLVSRGDLRVQVLGTKFNVNAYDDEADIKVTLLEGSVRVDAPGTTRTGNAAILRPGQQVIADHGKLKVERAVDLEQVMAWKNGFFSFHDADVQTVMRQLGRWYNVEVSYTGAAGTDKFTGEIDRSISLAKLLDHLARSRVHFKIEGRKLIVMP